MPLLGRLFGTGVSQAAGVGIGGPLASVLEPAVQDIRNEAWNLHQSLPIDAVLLASGVAQGQIPHDWAADEATLSGLNGPRFDRLVNVFDTGPGVSRAFDLLHRGLIDEAGFRRAVKREGIETEWIDALVKAVPVLLTPAELANARQQGYIDQARQYEEAAKSGIDGARAEIQFLSVGLPPGHSEASELLNRGLIDAAEFATMIREGHTKTKYTDVLQRAAQYVLTPINYVEGRLRGWIDDAAMYAGTSLRGVSKDDTDLLFKIHGRPLSWHQIWIGLRRGGTYNGPTTGIDPAFLSGLRQSDIRPEWYNLAWAQRFSYPAAFVLRALTQGGDLTAAESEQILLYIGWEPTLAAKVSARWAEPKTGTTQDPWIGKAETQLWTTTHKAYVGGGITQAQADAALAFFIETPATRTAVFRLWDEEHTVKTTPPPAP